MKNNFKKISLLFFLTITIVSCNSDADPIPVALIPAATVPCVTTNTLFQQLYNTLNTAAFPESLSGYNNAVTHEYTFNVTNVATICSIGYQSQTTLVSQNYQIDIYDTVTSTVVATITSTFSSTATSYTSLSTPFALVAGRSYKIKRYGPATVANPNGAGRCVSNNVTGTGNVSFPKTLGNLTITDSDFYTQNLNGQVSAGDNNNSMPFIDIVFQ
ncbi:hypothetical protein [Flavobacterium sp.]|uniref:hypothetical protein n=1 Tax=Flavobacterium sp. TaxID=239 RepID=UPI00286DBF20|nr:hypothetical protein [Flavobacterium sp.]